MAAITIDGTFMFTVAEDRVDPFLDAIHEFFRDHPERGFWVVAAAPDRAARAVRVNASSKIDLEFDDVSSIHAYPDEDLVRKMKRVFSDGIFVIGKSI